MMLYELLARPDRFFARRTTDSSLLKPALVVLAAGVANVSSVLVLMPKMIGAVPDAMASFVAVGNVIAIVSGLFTVFLLWVAYAGGFYLLSNLFDPDGSFRTSFKLVGWGFFPMIFSGLVAAIATHYALAGVTFPNDPAQLQPVVQQARNTPMLQISKVLGIVFTVWQGFLWMFAVKHARGLDAREALLTVSIPLTLSIVWSVYNLV